MLRPATSTPRPLLMRSLRLTVFCPSDTSPSAYVPRLTSEAIRGSLHALADIIRAARNLEDLHIDNIHNITCIHEELSEVIRSLQKLKAIHCTNVGPDEANMISNIGSPLTKISLDFEAMPPDTKFFRWDFEPMDYVLSHRNTLTELRLSNTPSYPKFSGDIVFPHLRRLTIYASGIEFIWLGDMAKELPNLKFLELRSRDPRDLDQGELRERRLENAGRNRAMGTWSSLDTLICDIEYAHALAFPCPVRYWHGVHLGYKAGLYLFRCVLEDIRPAHLDIVLDVFALSRTDIFPRSAPYVTHLNVEMCELASLCSPDELAWLEEIFESFTASLRNLSLTFLSIRFQFDEVDVYLRNLDQRKYVLALARALPTLEHVCIQFRWSQQPDGCWTITRPVEGRIRLALLGAAATMRVLENSPFAEKLCNLKEFRYWDYESSR
ncbi:hypothetical protein EIP91_007353 [Steccherinum ochraceum]|uniref:F-box domain-containing protein n=1 Tax=Steccherinum ochraceum TaxID=92696 RepID=A0A4R0RUB5_9APHY|nr:hypothetical protein EIP91_007353 [Steccherinum ochraceum]